MTLEDALKETEEFLTRQMPRSLRAVEYDMPDPSAEPLPVDLDAAAHAEIALSHVRGASDAVYRIRAFGDELTMRLQLNVRRFVVVYTIPVLAPVDSTTIAPHFERWQIGAGHAGWLIGWRDAVEPHRHDLRSVECYAYAMLVEDFLSNQLQQLYWRTDIVQMTRAFMLEAHRAQVPLARPGPRT
jgi:hypothetical protein